MKQPTGPRPDRPVAGLASLTGRSYHPSMRIYHRWKWLLAASLACGACAAMAGSATWPIDWHVPRYQDHALVGRIWSPHAQAWVTPAQLRAAVAKARFVILGATHDNADHHRVQAQLLQAVVDAGRHPTLGFEMLDLNQQPALAKFMASHPTDARALGPAAGWADSGWPAWSNYVPIAKVPLAHDLPIIATNLPAKTVKAVAFNGYTALKPEQVAALGLDKPWPAARRETMREELYKSHCELVPKSELTGMIHAQRTRNAIMAWRIVHESGAGGAVLITGSGHARTDYGVPLNLRQDATHPGVASVALIEVEPGKLKPSDYAAQYNVARLPYDYVLFTPAAARNDPCVALRKRFGGHAHK